MTDSPSHNSHPPFSSFERNAMLFFSDVAEGFQVPRFIGQVFALIYASPEPVGTKSLQSRLNLSKYVARTSVDYLVRIELVRKVYKNPIERIAYVPEHSPEAIVNKWAGQAVRVHLLKACSHLKDMEAVLQDGLFQEDAFASLKARADALLQWREKIAAGHVPFSHDGQDTMT
jgi:DNA-binding transcriptional regulator GbsR (MarR family)